MKSISNTGSFTDFYNNDRIYIDKTQTIYNLLTIQDKVFISRPRRFGKSLTINTIGPLFEKGKDPYFNLRTLGFMTNGLSLHIQF